jgi:(R)-2-hydroxyacyl-CoA dehydratese activating ATPase
MIFAGIDIGSISTETVLVDDTLNIINYEIISSGTDHKKSIMNCFTAVCEKGNIRKDDISYIVSTGYGRENVSFADKQMTEIACHGKGASFLFPGVRTIIDVGGQDSKVIKLNGHGKVIDFLMNDKCAAGTGRFLEVMAKALDIRVDEMGDYSSRAVKEITISSTCGIFAESEVISKIAQGESKEDIIKGIHTSISNRLISMAERLTLEEDVAMTGGGAKNSGLVTTLEEHLGIILQIPDEPQIIGALGAAVIACELYKKMYNTEMVVQ